MKYIKTNEVFLSKGESEIAVFIDKEFIKKTRKLENKIKLTNRTTTLYFTGDAEKLLLSDEDFQNIDSALVYIELNGSSKILEMNISIDK